MTSLPTASSARSHLIPSPLYWTTFHPRGEGAAPLFLLCCPVQPERTAGEVLHAAQEYHRAEPLVGSEDLPLLGAEALREVAAFPWSGAGDLLESTGLTEREVVELLTEPGSRQGLEAFVRANGQHPLVGEFLLETQELLSDGQLRGCGAMFLHGGHWFILGPALPR